MPKEAQESRRSYILRHAERLAETGSFSNCHAVEVAMRRQGFLEVFEVLHHSGRRELLSALCEQMQTPGDA